MSRPDVPAGKLRRPPAPPPPAAPPEMRAQHIRAIAGHKDGDRGTPHGCQLCRAPETIRAPLVVFSPEVDPNGQRITIAFCLDCIVAGISRLAPLVAPAGPPKRHDCDATRAARDFIRALDDSEKRGRSGNVTIRPARWHTLARLRELVQENTP